MNKPFVPKGRSAVPVELLQFGIHLVYAEGTKSEPFYINNIKQRISDKYLCSPNDVNIIPVSSKQSHSTTRLVKYAMNDVKNRIKGGKHIDHVWIFFDKDDFDGYKEAHESIVKLNNSDDCNADGFKYEKKTGIAWHSCPSNQCFELWYCLHYGYYNVAHDRKYYIEFLEKRPQLKKTGFVYEKSMTDLYDILTHNGGSVDNAIKYAKKLEKLNGISDPSTGVYTFMEYFKEYLK